MPSKAIAKQERSEVQGTYAIVFNVIDHQDNKNTFKPGKKTSGSL